MINYKIDENLIAFLQKKKINTPENLFLEMSLYPSKRRRPFDAIMYYWRALGKVVPQCTDDDISQLKRDFDHIFFAWHRLGFKPPLFPYAFLFRKIVHSKPHSYSPGLYEMTRFVRKLRCQCRKMRYDELFQECLDFDYREDPFKNIFSIKKSKMHTPLPDVLPKQIVTVSKTCPKILDVSTLKNVYKTKEEFDNAVKSNSFDIAKTFHVDKHGNFYSLCYKPDEVSLRKMQVSNQPKIQLEQTLELNKLLRAQSLL